MKKKHQNGKRKRRRTPASTKDPQETKASAEGEDKDSEATEDLEFDEEMVEQVRVQTSLIEERAVSREETIEMLGRVMRQHSLAPEKRRDYVVRYLKEKEENPP